MSLSVSKKIKWYRSKYIIILCKLKKYGEKKTSKSENKNPKIGIER